MDSVDNALFASRSFSDGPYAVDSPGAKTCEHCQHFCPINDRCYCLGALDYPSIVNIYHSCEHWKGVKAQ